MVDREVLSMAAVFRTYPSGTCSCTFASHNCWQRILGTHLGRPGHTQPDIPWDTHHGTFWELLGQKWSTKIPGQIRDLSDLPLRVKSWPPTIVKIPRSTQMRSILLPNVQTICIFTIQPFALFASLALKFNSTKVFRDCNKFYFLFFALSIVSIFIHS